MKLHIFLNHMGHRQQIGMLSDECGTITFEYVPAFLASGLPLSPYMLPLKKGPQTDPKQTFDGLFGVFNDSLPDGWGVMLLDRMLKKQGRELASVSPLERLALAGMSAMGALEYEPDLSSTSEYERDDLDRVADEAAKILSEVKDCEPSIEELLSLNGSLQGAQPKILLKTKEPDGSTGHWIVKVPAASDSIDSGLEEYRMARAAVNAGIRMPETRLFPSRKGPGFFGVRRFDRKNGLKVHMHTACGLLHAPHRLPVLDYENLLRLTLDLTKNQADVEMLVRVMAFNVYAGNCDDHSKNFSFIWDDACRWRLAPAYDLTKCPGLHGEHCAAVNGKGKAITRRDLLLAAEVGGLSRTRADALCSAVEAAVAEEGLLG